jgi:hypothetical protein
MENNRMLKEGNIMQRSGKNECCETGKKTSRSAVIFETGPEGPKEEEC